MSTPARSSGRRAGDSGGTTIAHGATEYAVVTSWPLPSLAAAVVAQWQAQLTFAPLRPASQAPKAPDLIWPALSRESLGGEVALLLGHPLLQPSVRHDLEYHPRPPQPGSRRRSGPFLPAGIRGQRSPGSASGQGWAGARRAGARRAGARRVGRRGT